jgi:hypothetical protein
MDQFFAVFRERPLLVLAQSQFARWRTSVAEGRGACVRLHPAQEGIVWNLVSTLGGFVNGACLLTLFPFRGWIGPTQSGLETWQDSQIEWKSRRCESLHPRRGSGVFECCGRAMPDVFPFVF